MDTHACLARFAMHVFALRHRFAHEEEAAAQRDERSTRRIRASARSQLSHWDAADLGRVDLKRRMSHLQTSLPPEAALAASRSHRAASMG